MLEQVSIVWVKGLFVMDKEKELFTRIKVKDKNYGVYEKIKRFDGTYGENAKKSEKESVGETKEKGAYRKGCGTIVGKEVLVEEKMVVNKEQIKKIMVKKMMKEKMTIV